MLEELMDRREALLGEIADVCQRCGRDPATVRIVAVTKFHPVSLIEAAYAAGFREIGENRIQEAAEKHATLSGLALRWHGIGHLQTNKAKLAVETFDEIHSLDRIEIIDKIAQAASSQGKQLAGYLQVNVSGKSGQSGCLAEDAPELLQRMKSSGSIVPVGLMCIAAPVDEVGETEVRKEFGKVRELRDRLISEKLLPDDAGMSMGMSGDWQLAVLEGATIIRIGSALFGERVYPR